MEDWLTIRNIKKKNPYMGTRKIARLVGVSRSTVKKALASEYYPRYHREPKVSSFIEPFVDYIREAYLIKRQKVSVIIENLRSKGFNGSSISIYRYIYNTLKPERDASFQRTYKPYNTLPGEQMLYDWSEYTVTMDGRPVKIYIHLVELGYSRYKYLDVTLSIKADDIFSVLENAFISFGGVCSRIQVDNAKVFILDASKANFRWNPRFLDFLGFYGVAPTRSLPYHPWSKGKVEKPFQYVEDHFIDNNTFASFDDLLMKLKTFEDKINNTVHSITKKTPITLFSEETPHLLELPGEKYMGLKGETRHVTKDCLISFMGSRYSVPHIYAGETVWVCLKKGVYVTITSNNNNVIATHVLSPNKGSVIINKEHYKGHIDRRDRESFAVGAKRLKARFGEEKYIEDFLEGIKSQKNLNCNYHLSVINRIFDDYPSEDCIGCINECLKYRCFTLSFVKGYLTVKSKVTAVPQYSLSRPLKEMAQFYNINVKRNMEDYRI